jgi:Serpin (serine protease inhibitor)
MHNEPPGRENLKEEENEHMSLVTSPYTIPAAFVAAEQVVHPNGLWVVGPERRWNPVNEHQRQYLELFELARKEVAEIPEIEATSSFVAEVLNAFLRVHGFSIALEPFAPDEFGVAAVLQVVLAWFTTGKAHTIVRSDGNTYPGVLLEQDLPAFSVPGRAHPVISLPTKTADSVYLTMIEKPANECAMIATARECMATRQQAWTTQVLFPMVDLDVKVALEWLKGMWTLPQSSPQLTVTQALRQTKVKMNEQGVRIEEAGAVGIVFAAVFLPHRHVIDHPFLMWVERPGLSLPLFVGYITEEDWKNPGTSEESALVPAP